MINIKKYKAEIQNLEPLECSVIYNPRRWENAFKNNKSVLDCVVHPASKPISRKTIIQEYKKYYRQADYDFRIPFLYTMIWGYNSNYGPPFSSASTLDKGAIELCFIRFYFL